MMKYLQWFTVKRALDAVYLTGSFVGAALVALNVGLQVWGFVFFFMSSIAGILLLRNSNASWSLMVVTVYYAIINLVGIIRA
jgi:hypothetical protein